tara:strand:- start:1802 stop:2035 length:234 start_codon:yes stop_codon:yes gene_type:complete
MTSKETTQDFMLHCADARIKQLVDDKKALAIEIEIEKSFNKSLQADNDRLHDLLDNSEDNVKRVSLLMSELKLNGSI